MSFPAYDEYRDSGVEWLGEVPAYWEVRRLKFLSEIQTGDKDTVDAEEDGEYPFFVRSQTVERISTQTFECEAILTAGDGVGVGKVFHYYNGPFDFHQRVYMMNNFRDVEGRFLFHYLRSNFYKVALEGGAKSTVDSIRRPMLTDFPVSFPPEVDEQKAISSFLDVETSKIDGLVSEQRRLIELLKEKRQAVISHAVTKGLNPNAPLKPSGIQWLGDVPEHWNVTKFARIAFMQEGPGLRIWQFTDFGTLVICVTNITENGIDFSSFQKFISTKEFEESYQHFTVNRGDILLSSSGNSWGKIAVYEGEERVMLNTSTIRVNARDDGEATRDYLRLALQSDGVREQLGIAMTGSCQPNFGPTHLKTVMVALPDIDEQNAIRDYVNGEAKRIEGLLAEAERAIELLQERRTALISAAVTGKIDVREFAYQETA